MMHQGYRDDYIVYVPDMGYTDKIKTSSNWGFP